MPSWSSYLCRFMPDREISLSLILPPGAVVALYPVSANVWQPMSSTRGVIRLGSRCGTGVPLVSVEDWRKWWLQETGLSEQPMKCLPPTFGLAVQLKNIKEHNNFISRWQHTLSFFSVTQIKDGFLLQFIKSEIYFKEFIIFSQMSISKIV